MLNITGNGIDIKIKEFIKAKVKKLGSINAVNKFYPGGGMVDEYARAIAREIYSKRMSQTPIIQSAVLEVQRESPQSPYQTPHYHIGSDDYLAALNRKKERDKQTGGIPEFEDGMPRTEFGTREDHKKMRGRDYGDMLRRRNE